MANEIRNNPEMDITAIISKNLGDWMDATPGLDTLQKLAAKSHVGFGTVRRAKNGQGNITVQNLYSIAETFGRHPAELLIDDQRETSGIIYKSAPDPTTLQINEAIPLRPKSVRQERIDTINELLLKIDDYGIVALLEKAKDIAKEYPADVSKTAS